MSNSLSSRGAVASRADEKDAYSTSDEPVNFERKLEPWLYLMKPFHKYGDELSVGLLRCRVIRSKDLPRMDAINSDPFCRLHLTQKGGEEHMQETKIIRNVRNAVWNETFEFEVTHTLCSLHIQVLDWDKVSKSDAIGVVEIPLAELQPKKKVRAWYPITLEENLHIRQIKKNVKKVKNSENPEQRRRCAAIEVELELDYSKIGDFASHFTVIQPPVAVEEDFDIDILYANAIELQNNIWPFIELLMCINPILLWTDPFNSGLVLLGFVECCLNTWMIPIVMQLFLIRYVCWQYVLRRWQVDEERRPKAVNKTRDENKRENNVDVKELERIKAEKKKERESQLNGLIASVAESSLSAAKMTETLKYTQNTLGFVNEWFDLIQEWLSWKYPPISGAILGTLVATTLYSCFFPFAYVALVVGVTVLCIFTVPMAVVIWLISGTAFYATQRAYIFAEFIEGVQERYLGRKVDVRENADLKNEANVKEADNVNATADVPSGATLLGKLHDADNANGTTVDANGIAVPYTGRSTLSKSSSPLKTPDANYEDEKLLERSDSEYTMMGSDDEDADTDIADIEGECGEGESRRRKTEGKPGKAKRKRKFLKRLFSINGHVGVGSGKAKSDAKDKEPSKSKSKSMSKSVLSLRRGSASTLPRVRRHEELKANKFGTL